MVYGMVSLFAKKIIDGVSNPFSYFLFTPCKGLDYWLNPLLVLLVCSALFVVLVCTDKNLMRRKER
jgi:hypothetical protein